MRGRTRYIICFYFFFFSVNLSAQQSMFVLSKFSRFAKVIRLGSAYTGYAKGMESINTNTAGLANNNLKGVIFSDAIGFPSLASKKSIYSVGLALPTSFYDVVFAASYDRLSLDLGPHSDYIESKIALHGAKKLSRSTSIGISLNYFRLDSKSNFTTTESPGSRGIIEMDTDAFDLSLGILHIIEDPFNLYIPNQLGFGFYIENFLGTKVKMPSYGISSSLYQPEPADIFQQARLGTSYEISSEQIRIADLNFVKMLFVFDAVFIGSNYSFELFQPNYGIQITFFEVLSFSYGRESEAELKDVYSSSLAYPVSRYGIGIALPLHKLFNINNEVTAEVNYCESDWDNKVGNFYSGNQLDEKGLSFSLMWKFN
ncbi:MAG: hypothetical protein CVV23_16565 [Ignavibacteriae bacterium HGW-Ignavibacteriae-2]|nr:MAG: hypothetical protein CVV23_16565 [Ignavibacteriae bacterium HGW-Ignavibacteriae-2]